MLYLLPLYYRYADFAEIPALAPHEIPTICLNTAANQHIQGFRELDPTPLVLEVHSR